MYSLDILGTSGPQLPEDMGQFLQGGNFGYFATSRHLEKKVERLFTKPAMIDLILQLISGICIL